MLKIVLLGERGDSTAIVANYLRALYPLEAIIIEDAVAPKRRLKNRIRKLGFRTTAGQAAFLLLVPPVLRARSKKRLREILETYHLDLRREYLCDPRCIFLHSVNSEECKKILADRDPDVVIVNGTRIISGEILRSVRAPFINMHTGITPGYRGVHGGYWALYQGDARNCGVTVHLVDEGIDTGNILYQDRIQPQKDDNFYTYPYLQIARGLALEKKALEDLERGTLAGREVDAPSRMYYHPTLFQYLSGYLRRGVK